MVLELTNKILNNALYKHALELLRALEKDRIFCRHDIDHFLSVARITMILCNEKGINADADTVYAAALLHDIGRPAEYLSGTPHVEASIVLAEIILDESGCKQDVKEKILSLISSHRKQSSDENSLESLFFTADKKSRLCFDCPAQAECKWPASKRNLMIGV